MKIKRQGNYELLRTILMFMVLFWHVIINIVFYHNTSESGKIFWTFLHFLLEIHIDTFILLTGYFQCKKEKIGIRKLIKLNNQAYFYKIIFLVIFLFFSLIKLTKVEIFWIAQPITLYNQYWYICIYMLLYICSPFLNRLLANLNKKEHRYLILALFIMSAIIPVMTNEMYFNNNRGFSLLNFILLYCIGSYLRIYPISESYIFSKLTSNARKITFLSLYFVLAILNLLIYYFNFTLAETGNELLNDFASIINNMKIAYNNPILILESIFFFLYFGEVKINSRIIDFLSARTLDVYLIHDNYLLRRVIYNQIHKYLGPNPLGLKFLILSFISSIMIFIFCIIIGLIREKIFILFNKIPIVRKRKVRLKEKINSLGFSITW